jgi:hypothetical protein
MYFVLNTFLPEDHRCKPGAPVKVPYFPTLAITV